MDMSRQKMKMSPVDFVSPDCQGELLKLDGNSKSWKSRFCVLSDAMLYLYVDKESESALGKCLEGEFFKIQFLKNPFFYSHFVFAWVSSSIHWKYWRE